MKTSIILVAAGKGTRLGQSKIFTRLAGKSFLEWNLELISELDFKKELVIAVPAEHFDETETMINSLNFDFPIVIVRGGDERLDSVKNALESTSGEIVIIHNVANPIAQAEDFYALHDLVENDNVVAFVGQQVVDTLRTLRDNHSQTLDRDNVWRVQTPQAFRKQSLVAALDSNLLHQATDEVMLFESSDLPIRAVECSFLNQKITYPQDLEFYEHYLRNDVLTGIGEDSHCFDETGTMILVGVEINELPKLKANSDGDLILHAIFNAISSALGEYSIGITADPLAEQGIIDSKIYLDLILDTVRDKGFKINNLSISIEALVPKIDPIVDQMKDSLAKILDIDVSRIGITATSGEGLTSFGKGEGVKCTCVVSLLRF